MENTDEDSGGGVAVEPHRDPAVRKVGDVDVRLLIKEQGIASADSVECGARASTTGHREAQRLIREPLDYAKVTRIKDVHCSVEIDEDGSWRVELAESAATRRCVSGHDGARSAAGGASRKDNDSMITVVGDVEILVAIDKDVEGVGEACGGRAGAACDACHHVERRAPNARGTHQVTGRS